LAAAHTKSQVADGQGLREAMAAGYGRGFMALAGVAAVSLLIALGFVVRARKGAGAKSAAGEGEGVPVDA
jgi:hypothetical protein